MENANSINNIFNESKIFFIIGIGRSGTSLLQEIMNTFSHFCNTQESVKNSFPNGVSMWSFVQKYNDYSHLVDFITKNWTDEYFVEKTPQSIYCLNTTYKQFPNANYIFLQRDPYDILLSQLNLFKNNEIVEQRKKQAFRNFACDEKDLKLNHEHFSAKYILKCIKSEIKYKDYHTKRITIRYELLIHSFREQVKRIATKFNISPNYNLISKVLSKPSSSSKNNTYDITKVSDIQALKLINEARKLWQY